MADPTPWQRADYLVRKLESFIREGKTDKDKGMSFKTWQAMTRDELTNAFAENDRRLVRSQQDLTAKRIILVATATVVTIGFWGTVVSVDHHFGELAAWIAAGAVTILGALAFEVVIRRITERYRVIAREKSFERIEDFDKQLKRLENELWLKLKRAKERAAEQE
jgi:hypothetical protein